MLLSPHAVADIYLLLHHLARSAPSLSSYAPLSTVSSVSHYCCYCAQCQPLLPLLCPVSAITAANMSSATVSAITAATVSSVSHYCRYCVQCSAITAATVSIVSHTAAELGAMGALFFITASGWAWHYTGLGEPVSAPGAPVNWAGAGRHAEERSPGPALDWRRPLRDEVTGRALRPARRATDPARPASLTLAGRAE